MPDPLRAFDVNLLVAFDALMQCHSVTRAAEQLHVSQSAVSHMLGRLRHALGDPLLVKHGNRMVATLRAEELHAGIRDGLSLVRSSLRRAEPFRPRTSNREFVLHAPEYFETILLPRLLDRLKTLAPNVRFRIELSLDELPVDEMARGTVDAVITVRLEQSEPKGLESVPLCTDRYVGLIRQRHPFAGKSVSLKQYAAFTHVLPYAVVAGRSRIEDWLLRQEIVPRVVQRCQSYISALGVLQSTDHMMVVPLRVGEFVAPGFDLRIVTLPSDFAPFELSYLTHPNAQADPAKQWLKSAILEIAGDLSHAARRAPGKN
ncbi:MAG TPA: LysR family transcriptional regulator [Steroidobacteraceae bacterium]